MLLGLPVDTVQETAKHQDSEPQEYGKSSTIHEKELMGSAEVA